MKHFHRPSPAMVIACIALLVALGGTSIAAVQMLPKNSVGTKQMKNAAVTGAKVKARTLNASKLADGVIPDLSDYYTRAEVDTNHYTKAQIDTNNYTKTQADARYLQGTITVVVDGPNVAPGDHQDTFVDCPSGYQATGGGADPHGIGYMVITSSGPTIDGNWLVFSSAGTHPAARGWGVTMKNTSAVTTYSFKVAAVCAPIG